MSKARVRCLFEVATGTASGDRCRRYQGHENESVTYASWHFPECGSAVNVDGRWVTDTRWITMFNGVEAEGEIYK